MLTPRSLYNILEVHGALALIRSPFVADEQIVHRKSKTLHNKTCVHIGLIENEGPEKNKNKINDNY